MEYLDNLLSEISVFEKLSFDEAKEKYISIFRSNSDIKEEEINKIINSTLYVPLEIIVRNPIEININEENIEDIIFDCISHYIDSVRKNKYLTAGSFNAFFDGKFLLQLKNKYHSIPDFEKVSLLDIKDEECDMTNDIEEEFILDNTIEKILNLNCSDKEKEYILLRYGLIDGKVKTKREISKIIKVPLRDANAYENNVNTKILSLVKKEFDVK